LTPLNLEGLEAVSDQYDTYFIDLFGVVCSETSLYPGVSDCLKHLSIQGKSVLFLTNSPHRAGQVIQFLDRIGIPSSYYQHILSAGEDVYQNLSKRHHPWYARLGHKYYFIGESCEEFIDHLPLSKVRCIEDADFILTLGATLWEDKLESFYPILHKALSYKIPMICANPNPGDHENQMIEAGAIGSYYKRMGGCVRYHGKPEKSFYKTALHTYDNRKRVLCIGDTLSIDIKGAQRENLDTAFVPRGIHRKALGLNCGDALTNTSFDDLFSAHDLWPNYILPSLKW